MTTPTPPDFRALCAELASLDGHYVLDCTEEWADAMCRLRAALEAQPEPLGPTDEELIKPIVWMMDECVYDNDKGEIAESLRELIARWGRPTIEPIPVSERLPGQEDCGPRGICWLWDPVRRVWHLTHFTYLNPGDFWLPYHALLIPRSEEI